MTLLEIRDQVKIDAGVLGNKDFPNVRLDNMINLAQRYVQTELNGLGMKKWETSVVTTTTQGAFHSQDDSVTFLLSELTNMLESPKPIKTLQVYDGTTLGYAVEKSVEEFAECTRNSYLTPSIRDSVFVRLINKVWVAPGSITDITAFYYDKIAELTSDSDVSEMPDEFIEQVIKKVVLEIDLITGKLQKKEQAIAQLTKDIDSAFQKFLVKEQVAQ